ncbi:MAG: acylphosphatase [Ignavibacteriae bacterium]|nr:acylphosphatase [Ignavibacteriota bacterium]
MSKVRAEIIVNGLVQGVGFRYFVSRKAIELNLFGFTKNQYDGSVITVVEGEKYLIEDFYKELKIGPMHADVRISKIKLSKSENEFSNFEVRY